MSDTEIKVPEPVDGRYIFEIDANLRIRFNADGWVEEIGKGGADDPLGTKLQGKPGTKLDDIFARRFYDLYSRCVMIDIHPKRSNDQSGTAGLILFRDLDQDSPLFNRVQTIIRIANHYFGMNLKEL